MPTPPQLKRVLPPVVPARRDSLTPEREPAYARPPGDGSERTPPRLHETRVSPPRLTATHHQYGAHPEPESDHEPEPEPEWKPRRSEPEPEPEWKLRRSEPEPEQEPEWMQRKSEPEPEPEEEPSPFASVLKEPTQVRPVGLGPVE